MYIPFRKNLTQQEIITGEKVTWQLGILCHTYCHNKQTEVTPTWDSAGKLASHVNSVADTSFSAAAFIEKSTSIT